MTAYSDGPASSAKPKPVAACSATASSSATTTRPRRLDRSRTLSTWSPAVGAEHEIALPVRDVIERHGRERLEERHAGLRDQRVLDAAVDDDDVALP